MEDTINSVQILKRSGTLDNSEKGPEVKALSRRGRSKIHPSNGKALLSWGPLLIFIIIDPSLRKVIICGLPGLFMIFVCISVNKLIQKIIRIIIDQLLIWEMDSQMVDGWLFCMHGKFKYMPAALYSWDVTCINIFFDLIDGMLTLSYDLKSGAIMTFIDVLVNVFDGFDRSANLHIDVTIWRARQQ